MEDFYAKLLETAQVKRGDIIDVASDLLGMMLLFRERHETFDPDLLLDALKKAVGEEGTVLIRTFNWSFCQGVPFHYKTTPSQVGLLGNIALKRPDFKRTKHALYSWCVWGKEQETLAEMDPPDSFGDDSIFAFLEDHNADLLRIGDIETSALTSVHRSEQRANIPERFIKHFTGLYTGSDGICREKTYSMFVRDLNYDIRPRNDGRNDIGNIGLQRKGVVISQYQYQGIVIDKIDLRSLGEVAYQDFLTGKWGDWMECSRKDSAR